MKKIRTFAVALMACALVFAFSSCEKEGVFKPKERISKIFVKDNNGNPQLSQTWVWEKGLLSSISTVGGGTIHFNYDGKVLSSITAGDDVISFTYDGKKLEKMTYKEDGETEAEYEFTHDGKRIVTIKATMDNAFALSADASLLQSAFNFIAPQLAESQVSQLAVAAKSQGKGIYTYTDQLTYDGMNVVSVKRHDSDDHNYTWDYTYTSYANPFYHLLAGGSDIVGFGLSKNATSGYHYADDYITSRVIDMEITYPSVDGKYPLQETRTEKTTHTVGGLTNIYTDTDDIMYEYE